MNNINKTCCAIFVEGHKLSFFPSSLSPAFLWPLPVCPGALSVSRWGAGLEGGGQPGRERAQWRVLCGGCAWGGRSAVSQAGVPGQCWAGAV